MSVSFLFQNILKHAYRSRTAMLADVDLLYTNSVQYNGVGHAITATAAKIVQTCKEQFAEHADQFDALERNLEQQALTIDRTVDQQSNDEGWQQMMTTETAPGFTFTALDPGQSSIIIEFICQNVTFQNQIRI